MRRHPLGRVRRDQYRSRRRNPRTVSVQVMLNGVPVAIGMYENLWVSPGSVTDIRLMEQPPQSHRDVRLRITMRD